MTLVVIDASAGVEIVCDTRRGRGLARLLPVGPRAGCRSTSTPRSSVCCAGSFSVKSSPRRRRRSPSVGSAVGIFITRPSRPLVQAAWNYRHNLTAADALYVALAKQLGASPLTDDQRLARAPTFPSHVPVVRLPASL